MEQWLQDTFKVTPDDWEEADGSTTDAFEFMGAKHLVKAPLNWFVSKFGAAGAPPSATSLKAQDPQDALGWHKHFDAWVAQGIIQP